MTTMVNFLFEYRYVLQINTGGCGSRFELGRMHALAHVQNACARSTWMQLYCVSQTCKAGIATTLLFAPNSNVMDLI